MYQGTHLVNHPRMLLQSPHREFHIPEDLRFLPGHLHLVHQRRDVNIIRSSLETLAMVLQLAKVSPNRNLSSGILNVV